MFSIIEDVYFPENSTHNQTSINHYIANAIRRNQNTDFYIYDEGRYNSAITGYTNFEGEICYPRHIRPDKIGWYVSGNDLHFSNPFGDDIYPISTLHFILDELSHRFNLSANGSVILINNNTRDVFYYIIKDSKIYKHINKTMYLDKYYKYAFQLNRDPEIDDPEFREIINRAFIGITYMEYLNNYGEAAFIETLAYYI